MLVTVPQAFSGTNELQRTPASKGANHGFRARKPPDGALVKASVETFRGVERSPHPREELALAGRSKYELSLEERARYSIEAAVR